MKCLFVARTEAPSQCFEIVSEKLKTSGADAAVFLGHGKPFADSRAVFLKEAETADVIILGMSYPPEFAEDEIAVGEWAAASGTPFGFFADTYGTYHRGCFSDLLGRADFLFVVNVGDAAEARKKFPKTEIIVSGNPLWENFFFPKMTREIARKRVGLAEHEKAIFCPGGKNLTANILQFGAVMDAVSTLGGGYKVFLTPHPGDSNGREAYRDLCACKKVSVRLVEPEFMTSAELLSGVDIVVSSASALGIEAACRRMPVIDYFSAYDFARLEEETGRTYWEPCRLGVSEFVCGDARGLAAAILRLTSDGGFDVMRKRQSEAYLEPKEKGGAFRIIAETILKYAAARRGS